QIRPKQNEPKYNQLRNWTNSDLPIVHFEHRKHRSHPTHQNNSYSISENQDAKLYDTNYLVGKSVRYSSPQRLYFSYRTKGIHCFLRKDKFGLDRSIDYFE